MLLVILVLGLCHGALGLAATLPIDDFNDGNDAGWNRGDSVGGGGPATYSFQGGSYHMASTGNVAPSPFNAVFSLWAPSINDPQYANGLFRAKVRVDEPDSTFGLILRNAVPTGEGYGFWASGPLGTFYIDEYRPPMPLPRNIAMGDAATLPFAVGEDWYLEGGAVGDQISLKAWKVGDPEPARPQLVATSSLVGPEVASGLTLIGLTQDASQPVRLGGSFDDVVFTIPEPGIEGDYNHDGQVEQGDLDLVLLNWGQQGVPGGWTNDLPEGPIDQGELDGVLLQWGGSAALAAASVPEPGTVVTLLFLLASFAATRCPLFARNHKSNGE
jgi:hypothetical protein